MKYHAPTKAFVVPAEALQGAALALKWAIKHVREQAGLPLESHKPDGPMEHPQFAEAGILDAARHLGIDLGADRPGQLDVHDADERAR